jgi:uncharacterized coiled-coil DUF342 family protein
MYGANFPALHWVRQLYPPHTVLHVGYGAGLGPLGLWQGWKSVRQAVLVDAWPERPQVPPSEAGAWPVLSALVADRPGEQLFHVYSSTQENGLLPPEQLQRLWPNLRVEQELLLPAVTLDQVWADQGISVPEGESLWAIIECLPALTGLRGGSGVVSQASVVILRVVLDQTLDIAEETKLAAARTYLEPMDFALVDVQESIHPAIGYALFVREWRRILGRQHRLVVQERDALAGEVSGHKQRLAELEGELSRLTQARDGAIQQARAQEAQIAALAKEKDGLAQKVAELEQSLQTEVQARHEAAQQAAACAQEIQGLKAAQGKLEAQVAALTQKEAQILQARDAAQQAADQRAQEIACLAQERDALAGEVSGHKQRLAELEGELSRLTQARDGAIQQARAQEAQIAALAKEKDGLAQKVANVQQENEALRSRQHLMEEEITRAEAQIDLIKDLLLREPEL